MACLICARQCKSNLCGRHSYNYIWDSNINGFRLKKRNRGSRYTRRKFHRSEIELTKLLEAYYGRSDVVTSYHPIWAVTSKGVLYEYDIYLKSKDLLIEYNGIQHYEFNRFFHRNKAAFNRRLYHDATKAELARVNNKQLIIFRYNEPLFGDYVINKVEKYGNKD